MDKNVWLHGLELWIGIDSRIDIVMFSAMRDGIGQTGSEGIRDPCLID